MTQFIAITGMLSAPKNQFATLLAQSLQQQGKTLTLLDNNDAPLLLDGIPRHRLVGGCVCCSLAGALIPLVNQVQTDYGILTVSAQADPQALEMVLNSLKNARRSINQIALLDAHTQQNAPYLAAKLTLHAHYTLHEPYDFAALLPQLFPQ